MKNDLKTRIRVSNTLDKRTVLLLQQLSKQLKIPMSRLLDEAIYDLVQKYQ